MRITILGSHPNNGHSMLRFTELLAVGYEASGHEVTVLRPSDALSRLIKQPRLRKLIAYFEQLLVFPIRVILSQPRVDWLHLADHSDALWLLWPIRATSQVVTCHDLLAVRAARGEIREHRTRLSGRVYQKLVMLGLRRTNLVEAVSDATLSDVQRLVQVVHAVRVYNPLSPSISEFAQANLVSPLAYKYALVVSSSGWRKRREHAVQVWLRLVAEPGWEQLRLAVVGPTLTADELGSIPAGLRAQILEYAKIDDVDLSRLYSGATVLLQVSKYEGFGWPIVEANAFGVPAICSDEPVFREVGGRNIFIGDDLDETDWAKITSAILDPFAAQNARMNAQRFTMVKFSDRLEELRLQSTTQEKKRTQEVASS